MKAYSDVRANGDFRIGGMDVLRFLLDNHIAGGRQDMPRKSPFRRCVEEYVQHMRKSGMYAPGTITAYERAIKHCQDIVAKGGGRDNPRRVTEDDLRRLLDSLPDRTTTRKYYFTIYAGFLKCCGNEPMNRMKPRWPLASRINVDWLDPEQADRVREVAMGLDPLTALVVHLELDLMLRRIEVLRLRVQDIRKDSIEVLGKGRFGGKPRTVSLTPGESEAIIGRGLEVRNAMLSQTEGRQTDKLAVYLRERTLVPYKRSALDAVLDRLKRESGVVFKGHHTLRRTGGRLMWQEGVAIETVASIMGHETTEMTLRYIGVNLDDQAKAFQTVRDARIQRAKSVEIVPLRQMPEV